MHELVLSARGLRKCYRGRVAVDSIDLDIARGERVALVGPNGAGKTTTLMSCLGLVQPDAGRIELLGATTARGRRAALGRVGFAAGYLPLPPHIRVAEYLSMFARLYGSPDPAGQALAGLRRFGIEDLARRMGPELSSGQRTLVGIVKATLHSPALLILDEPTASLDPDVAKRARGTLLRQCEEDGASLLITSHNMTEVERLAQRVIFIRHGRVVLDDRLDRVASLYGHESLEDTYLQLTESDEPSVAEPSATTAGV
jgi:ABC-2 type transport system ATP-binding protein